MDNKWMASKSCEDPLKDCYPSRYAQILFQECRELLNIQKNEPVRITHEEMDHHLAKGLFNRVLVDGIRTRYCQCLKCNNLRTLFTPSFKPSTLRYHRCLKRDTFVGRELLGRRVEWIPCRKYPGRVTLFIDNYRYIKGGQEKAAVAAGTQMWACCKYTVGNDRCMAKAYTDSNNQVYKLVKEHNHPPNVHEIIISKAQGSVASKVDAFPNKSSVEIFKEVIEEVREDALTRGVEEDELVSVVTKLKLFPKIIFKKRRPRHEAKRTMATEGLQEPSRKKKCTAKPENTTTVLYFTNPLQFTHVKNVISRLNEELRQRDRKVNNLKMEIANQKAKFESEIEIQRGRLADKEREVRFKDNELTETKTDTQRLKVQSARMDGQLEVVENWTPVMDAVKRLDSVS